MVKKFLTLVFFTALAGLAPLFADDELLLKTLEGHSDGVLSVAFSPDGKYIASGSWDKTIKLWNVSDGSLLRTLKGHTNSVSSVAFSPDGKYIASGSWDDTIRLWRVSDGLLLRTFEGHTGDVESVSFSPDGKYIASGSWDKTIKLWNVSISKIIAEAKRREIRRKIAVVIIAIIGIVVVLFLFLMRKWVLLSGKIKKYISTGDIAHACILFSKYRKGFLWSNPVLTNFSAKGLWAIYSHQNKIDELLKEELPDDYKIHFAKKLIETGEYEKADELYKKYTPTKFTPEEVLMLFQGLDRLAILDSTNIPVSWLMSYARDFFKKNEFEKAYLMLKNKEKILSQLQTGQEIETVFKVYEKNNKKTELLDFIGKQKIAKVAYDFLINEFYKQKDFKSALTILKAKQKFYSSDMSEPDYQLLFSLLDKLNCLGELQPSDLPKEYWAQVLKLMESKGLDKELMKFLSAISEWTLKEYELWFDACFKQGMLDMAAKSPAQIRQRKDGEEILNMYYGKAIKFEATGENQKALSVYKKFVDEKLFYKDVADRYINLSGGKKSEEIRKSARPDFSTRSDKETLTSRTSEEASHIGKKYEIIREIGRGGMGIVYEAVNRKIGKKVALKKMKDELAINPRERKRFIEEARRVAALHHPNITDIYDIVEGEYPVSPSSSHPFGKGEFEGGIYLVFEYVEGKTVEQILHTVNQYGVKDAVDIIKQVCEALKYAHGRRIIHRDIKPSNIIVDDDGIAKVMDFGIAREAKDTFSRITGKDTSGTLAYMAPEQELGSYSEQSDIFSVGVCLYEMLTGELPFKGPNFLAQKREMLYKRVREIEPAIPESIESVIEKCLQAAKEKRYNNIISLIEDIGNI